MADEQVPVTEVRRVVIQYEIQFPHGGSMSRRAEASPPRAEEPDIVALAEQVRRELIRTGVRNGTAGIP